MPICAGRVGRKHSHRKRDRRASAAEYRGANKQRFEGCIGDELVDRVQLSIKKSNTCPIGLISPMGRASLLRFAGELESSRSRIERSGGTSRSRRLAHETGRETRPVYCTGPGKYR